jgi:hypothetical protein
MRGLMVSTTSPTAKQPKQPETLGNTENLNRWSERASNYLVVLITQRSEGGILPSSCDSSVGLSTARGCGPKCAPPFHSDPVSNGQAEAETFIKCGTERSVAIPSGIER